MPTFVIHHKPLLLIRLALLVLLLTACAQDAPLLENITAVPPAATSTATPRPTATVAATLPPLVSPTTAVTPLPELPREGFTFEKIRAVARDYVLEENPGEREGATHWRVNMTEYAAAGLELAPAIEIFAARDIAGRDLLARRAITALDDRLQKRPPLGSGERDLFLELLRPESLIYAAPAYLSFQNGDGVRVVAAVETEAGLALVYRYQGLTADRSGYIEAFLPLQVENSTLPAAGADPQAWVAALENGSPADFTPQLADLDRLMGSFRVDYPEPAVTITSDGRLPLTLFYPPPDGIALSGHPLAVEGYLQPGEVRTLLVSLMAGESVVRRETIFSELNGHFLAEIAVPFTVQGPVNLLIETAGEQVARHITIAADPLAEAEDGPALTLARPAAGEVTVAGKPLFFEGEAVSPIDGEITIGVLVDRCTVMVARQTISLPSEGGPWRGMIIPPETVIGAGCAVVFTGTPGIGEWREARASLQLAAVDDPAAPRVVLGNPADTIYLAGESWVFYGGVTGPDRRVVVTLTGLEGEALAMGETTADRQGYWELALEIPPDAAGPAQLVLSLPGEPEAERVVVELVIQEGG